VQDEQLTITHLLEQAETRVQASEQTVTELKQEHDPLQA